MNNKSISLTSLTYVLLLLLLPGLASSQCTDKNPSRRVHSAYAYQNFGNYCEGIIVAEVAAPSLEVVGVIRGRLKAVHELPQNLKKTLWIQTDSIRRKPLSIRVVSIPLGLHYRLDDNDIEDFQCKWQLENVVIPMSIPLADLGMYSWYKSQGKIIYVPVMVHANSRMLDQEEKVCLLLRSSRQLSEVHWRILNTDFKGKLAKENFVPGTSIRIPLDNLPKGQQIVQVAYRIAGTKDYQSLIVDIDLN